MDKFIRVIKKTFLESKAEMDHQRQLYAESIKIKVGQLLKMTDESFTSGFYFDIPSDGEVLLVINCDDLGSVIAMSGEKKYFLDIRDLVPFNES